MEEHEYVERAKKRILEVLDTEKAVVVLELEARLSEAGYADSGLNINPHHVTSALRDLTRAGDVLRASGPTRGGAEIDTIQPANQRGRTTAIAQAAARKRLLYARYRGWAQSSVRNPSGLVGPAGEEAVRAALRASGALQPAHPEFGPVSSLLGITLTGPVDSAGFLVPFSQYLPGQPVTVLVEVKNLRGWIYPNSAELYQLLSKATALQQAHPDQPIMPVLVCRKAHETTYWMAHQLGFVVIAMDTQFVGTVDEDALNQVRTELHFQDLRHGHGPSLRVRDRFRDTLPGICTRVASQWCETALHPDLSSWISYLKEARRHERNMAMVELRAAATAAGHRGGW